VRVVDAGDFAEQQNRADWQMLRQIEEDRFSRDDSPAANSIERDVSVNQRDEAVIERGADWAESQFGQLAVVRQRGRRRLKPPDRHAASLQRSCDELSDF